MHKMQNPCGKSSFLKCVEAERGESLEARHPHQIDLDLVPNGFHDCNGRDHSTDPDDVAGRSQHCHILLAYAQTERGSSLAAFLRTDPRPTSIVAGFVLSMFPQWQSTISTS